jgi:hypothetical protein
MHIGRSLLFIYNANCFVQALFCMRSAWNSTASSSGVNMLRSGWSRNQSSISGSKRRLPSPRAPNRTWDLPSLLALFALSPGVKQPKREPDH